MTTNFKSWEISRHKSIKCVDCHAREGILGYVQAKLGGVRQLIKHISADTIDDIHVNEKQQGIISDNCRRCHESTARIPERPDILISHKRHLEIGVDCVKCHSSVFAHPREDSGEASALLAETGACMNCHNGKNFNESLIAFDATRGESCSRCHPDAKLALNHGGMEQTCGDCHEATEERHFSYSDENVSKICSTCHDIEDDFTSTHEPYKKRLCLECHQVMSPAHLYKTASRPSPDTCFTCHKQMSTLLSDAGKSNISKFSDGKSDLHRVHSGLFEPSEDWCLTCHGAHGSKASVAMIRIRVKNTDGGPGVFAATATGGTCTGACHEDDTVTYTRGFEPSR